MKVLIYKIFNYESSLKENMHLCLNINNLVVIFINFYKVTFRILVKKKYQSNVVDKCLYRFKITHIKFLTIRKLIQYILKMWQMFYM